MLILGAGPCGLGAAWRLQELGFENFEVFEKENYVGGLSASFQDEHGFTWDIGGHVHFSHFDYFDRLMQALIPPDGWVPHERESWIWMMGRFIPYPLQYNIGRLPKPVMLECLAGLLSCNHGSFDIHRATFRDWILNSFGEGIAKYFMIPYNKKVWAYPPEELDAHWIGERVAVPDVQRILKNIVLERDDCSWGPNNTFSFPLRGGTGSIWNELARRLPKEKLHLQAELVAWDSDKKMVRFGNGDERSYDYLISTIPLNELLARDTARSWNCVDRFLFSASHIVGIGIKGLPPDKLRTKCWMYFPEDDNPFYRVTVFSNYSPGNVPDGEYWSLMGEISESPKKPVDPKSVIPSAIDGFIKTHLIDDPAAIVSIWTHRAAYAYPTPFLGRDKLVDAVLHELLHLGVYSRGRFGAWKYEVSNQDHVLMQGVEAVENILFGTPEITLRYPSLVNSQRVR
ncbi:MAG: FAD-dependent oxidoreductase [Desulfobacterota bacterium]|nr:FAD-dependent oxidoreductase [Thermodesulfobacteriota bacterium]